MICPQCNLPRYYGPTGIAAPQCLCVRGYHGPSPAAPAPEAPTGDGGLKRFLALAEAAGIKSINDLPGLIPALQATEAQAAGQELDEHATFFANIRRALVHGLRSARQERVEEISQAIKDLDAWQARAALAQRQSLTDDERAELDRLRSLVNTPELHDFSRAVVLEAAHQRERWGSAHDAGKAPQDWFWLLGYLGGKALAAHAAGNTEKALHHTISSAAALANWHAAISGSHTAMRPGIDPAAHGIGATTGKEPDHA